MMFYSRFFCSLYHHSKIWLRSLLHLFFPDTCLLCGEVLQEGEEHFCIHCMMYLPYIHPKGLYDNDIAKMFWGKFPIEKAFSLFYYRKESNVAHLIHHLKYNGEKYIGIILGRMMAESAGSSFFEDIDIIVPVPLHKKREQERGYNQSEVLAMGISEITGIPVRTDLLERVRSTDTQTKKSATERWTNVAKGFRKKTDEDLSGRHLLLVDDVLTTGATMTACSDALHQEHGIKISVMSVAWAGGS